MTAMTASAPSRSIGFVSLALLVLSIFAPSSPALAQLTSGSVVGSVRDTSGGVIPGCTVILVSASRGTTLETTTNTNGDFTFPNVTGDTYLVRVTVDGFKTLERKNIPVSPGERVVVPTLTLELGALSETVIVTGEAPLIQAQSGERSHTIPTVEVENLPYVNRSFHVLTELTPGTFGSNRLGGGGQNNIMIDGVSTMDTGNNGIMLQMNTEAIAEVRVLTQGYQAEFGRSSGLQITAVTKSGSNQFRGSLYDIERNSDWNSNSWENIKNGDPKPVSKQRDWGYSLGGPIGTPGGANKLFFFYSHEYRPRESGGAIRRFRVPTVLERQGDFSQSTDRNGNLVNLIRDFTIGLPCTASNTAGCFQDGGVLGRIPQDRLYQTGRNILKMWPEPNAEGLNFNYQNTQPTDINLIQQPVIRVDYQPSPVWRVSSKFGAQHEKSREIAGTIPGFNDRSQKFAWRVAYSATANYNINATTFLEATYGWTQNRLSGGRGQLTITEASNRNNIGLGDLPLLFPDAGVVDPRYYAAKTLPAYNTPYYVDGKIWLPPSFEWGNLIGTQNQGAPPNLQFAGWLNINRTQDFAVSLTKVMNRHTVKTGFYLNHSYKAQNLGAGGGASFEGLIDFGNDTNNPLDAGFGFANAALGTFSSFQQHSKFVEGTYMYNNIEGYIQDNWKVTQRLTLDYGLRFTHMQPQYDKLLQTSNFFPELWDRAQAPVLFVPGCPKNVDPCATNARQAVDPVTGQSLGPASAWAIGQIVPNSGDLINGLVEAGTGINPKENYRWPALAVAPRIGAAYDLTGTQSVILRGAAGLFFDRPTGNSIYAQVGNPPFSTTSTVRYGQLQTLGSEGVGLSGPPRITGFEPDAKVPASWQWNAGVQMAMPWATVVDFSYVGQRGFNRLNTDHGAGIDINAAPFEAAYRPENQDPTRAPSATPGATALSTDLLRPYRGYGQIFRNWNRFWDEYHSLQMSLNRRFLDGIQFGLNYTLSLKEENNRQVPVRLQHNPDGTFSLRDDQPAADDLLKQGELRRHVARALFVWDLPDLRGTSGATQVAAAIVNDWQLSGVFRGGSGERYDIDYDYQRDGSNVNLTGSPSYEGRVNIVGDPGSGCSDDPYAQFNTAAFAGPLPGSVGLESGRNYMVGCPDRRLDLAIARSFRLGGSRRVEVRAEIFNVLNTVIYDADEIETDLELVSPTNQTVRNSQTLPDGSLDPKRLVPRNAGFGAATEAMDLRSVQLQVRFQF